MLNKVLLIGYAGADSEMKFTPGGIPVANFSLAVNETYRTGTGRKRPTRSGSAALPGAAGRRSWANL